MTLNLMTIGSSHVSYKNMFCMCLALGHKSDFHKNVVIFNVLLFKFSIF